jgi:sporulation protein YlmC with PRC-barrel domain
MFKQLMIGTALGAFALSSALAQSTPPASSDSSSTPPAASSSPSTTGQMSTSGEKFVSSQSSEQMLATKFTGTDVVGTDDKKIGDVNDVLFDKQGKIMAYVVGVGGFLGIGSKDVALAPAAFQVQPASDRDELKLKLTMTRDELKNAPEFKAAASRPAPTTGQAPPRDRAPATPPAR